MKLLLTNDDGVHAPGLEALQCAAARLGETVVVAPHEHASGCSHQVTTHRPLELGEIRPKWYMLDGSPADCARLGISHLASDAEWVISGVNQGGNLGADVYVSGTVAAAREACLLGKRAIAISQYHRRAPLDWRHVAAWTEHVLQVLFARPLEPGTFWNVNLPHLDPSETAPPECVFCRLDPNPLPVSYEELDGRFHYRGSYHERVRTSGHDVDVCFSGRIAITQMRLEYVSPPLPVPG